NCGGNGTNTTVTPTANVTGTPTQSDGLPTATQNPDSAAAHSTASILWTTLAIVCAMVASI
ncbi:hypothetical protein BGZ76_009714, partial [Entomortierella beljakovae]